MIEELFLQSVIKRFKEYKAMGEKTFSQLSAEDMNRWPNEASNSIAVIIQHMEGNMVSRWTNFLTEDGEKSWRKRDEEFEEQSFSKEALLEKWNRGWTVFLNTLESLQPADLTATVTIRNQPLTVVDAINRQMAHYSYHVGQIVYLGRMFTNQNWQTLSIPKGNSRQYNEALSGKKN